MIDYYSEAPELIRNYLIYSQTVKGKSPSTVKETYLDLRMFFRFMKLKKHMIPDDTDLTDITIDDIDIDFIKSITLEDGYDFMIFLQDERNDSAATRKRKVASLSSFFKYITNKKQLLEHNPFENLETPRIGKRMPKYLTLEQCYALLNAVQEPNKARDYCILVLFLNCGLRLSELCSINYNSISGNKLRIIGKGNKERTIYLNESCLKAIKAYKLVRPVDGVKDKNALFISRNLNRISNNAVQRMVQKYLNQIGLEGQGYSVHKLRHTAATLMYQYGGVDIRTLKEILGHQNLGTTEIYTHLADKQMEDASNQHPLANI